ncbi:MAG TPA: hydrogen peroxide-inducible genes activator [Terriglobales bacterium]|jgi:LysR family hydrogen peroxide-inducible transcriptional activator|nr:hydrogen peroxide-inducible genes activator [Terriglobales bacterium]
MEIHQIRYVCAVVETGSFTAAAAREHVAQPSLSQQVIKLEDELGTELFHRFRHKIRLTEFGKAFFPKAQDILRAVSSAKSAVYEMTDTARGPLKVGAIPTIAPYLLPKVLPSFSREFPEVNITISEDITPILLQKLQETALDIVIVALPVQGAELLRREILRERLFLVASVNHVLCRGSSACLKDLAAEPFLVLKEGHCFRDTAVAACKRASITPNVVFESGHFATILSMVAAGMGISIVPEMAVEPHPGCKFIPIEDERAIRRVGVVRLQSHFYYRPQREFMDHLTTHVKRQMNLPQTRKRAS